MDFETVSDKHLNDLERLTKELLEAIRRARLTDQPLIELLRELEQETGKVRRERFDAVNTKYRSY